MMVPILGVVLLILGGTVGVHEEPFDKAQFEEMANAVIADESNQKKPQEPSSAGPASVAPETELKDETSKPPEEPVKIEAAE